MRVRRPDGDAAGSTREPLNRETRRRADEAGIFPCRDALIRRVGAVIAKPSTPEEVTLTITA